ncbi:restriction endonuclease [Streptomyces malaysiensis]|uniref:restriction endonuclease n=1 Tax=Streptomyces malaysiensis TaxID=92644 RepID=UPI002042DC3F|nr:restriction endonuclease [Streptomyces sp. DR7-3]MCM3804939.1 restriction endonuclease [Streptomyces sp. DR7-3]
MTSTHTVLYDPQGRIEGKLPLDRETHQRLVAAVLAWAGDPGLHPSEYHQIALQLTAAARAVADDVRRTAEQLPADHPARILAEHILDETRHRLSKPLKGTASCAQDRARLCRSLYGRLDRLTDVASSLPGPRRSSAH